jgi:hypothetical protein
MKFHNPGITDVEGELVIASLYVILILLIYLFLFYFTLFYFICERCFHWMKERQFVDMLLMSKVSKINIQAQKQKTNNKPTTNQPYN